MAGGPTSSIPDDAKTYDASGADDCNIQLYKNTIFSTTRVDQKVTKEVDGQQIEFTKVYDTSNVSSGSYEGVSAAPGYVMSVGISPNQMWSWSDYYHSGWEAKDGVPTSFPYGEYLFGK